MSSPAVDIMVILASLVGRIPTLLVLLVIVAVGFTRLNKQRKAASLAIAGASIMLIGTVLGTILFSVLPSSMSTAGSSTADTGTVMMAASGALTLIHAAGLALLGYAVFVDRPNE